ncbi:DUF1566 domain-containing protein [candidate division KSB3 bacterium]|uniref:DUF1566 domain-containing protein n=1 Tax=candidate division KSB3 bacterium TaxID=2044937 RepID=A0A9D5JUW4_9BACT|nr:DUF1566 domain-containing protein [candidate division KSB3 bacterium]MBD3324559.1 DUF1566 domain-containing protein [candidate division KSB3 bacterium]
MNPRHIMLLGMTLLLLLGLSLTVQAADDEAAVIEQAQQQLQIVGYDPGPVDGLWGPKTQAAVKAFQRDAGLAATGNLDDPTRARLTEQVREQKQQEASFLQEPIPPKQLALRSTPAALTSAEIVQMIREHGFHHPAATGVLSESITGNMSHQYEGHTLAGDKIVVDYATGLMWQQAAADFVPGADVQRHIERMNGLAYAGFSDWRLPTIAELASLLEPPAPDTPLDFIAPVFEVPLWFCLSADTVPGAEASVWVVSFEDGYILDHTPQDDFYILLVRAIP